MLLWQGVDLLTGDDSVSASMLESSCTMSSVIEGIEHVCLCGTGGDVVHGWEKRVAETTMDPSLGR